MKWTHIRRGIVWGTSPLYKTGVYDYLPYHYSRRLGKWAGRKIGRKLFGYKKARVYKRRRR